MAQTHLTALPPGRELEPCERVDRDRVDADAADVAAGDLGSVLAQQRADAVAEPGQIVEFTFFLETETVFPQFGLPPRLES